MMVSMITEPISEETLVKVKQQRSNDVWFEGRVSIELIRFCRILFGKINVLLVKWTF